jgi:hypothetical protein
MKNSTLKSLVFLVVGALMLVASCSAPEIEEVVEVNPRTTIPFSVVVATDMTKVSYADAKYAFKTRDSFVVESGSSERDDIEGTLAFNGTNKLTGKISFDSDKPLTNSTRLKITLINADNSDRDSYAKGIAATLQEAVENYSLFTTTLLFNDATTESSPQSVSFAQQAAFLEITVNFTNLLTSSMPTGETPVELATADGLKVSGKAEIIKVGSDYKASFVAALPGGTEMQGSKLSVCEREIAILSSSKVIDKNKQYKVARSVDFSPQLGDPFWSDGSYGSIQHGEGVSIIGIVMYVKGNVEGDAAVVGGDDYHALVMSLKNVESGGTAWGTEKQRCADGLLIKKPENVLDFTRMDGYTMTSNLINNINLKNPISSPETTETAVAAAYKAWYYRGSAGTRNVPNGTTGWFLPSIGQWLYSISGNGFGGALPVDQWVNANGNNWRTSGELSHQALVLEGSNALATKLNSRLQTLIDRGYSCEFDGFAINDNYSTCSENGANNAIRFNISSDVKLNGKIYSAIKTATVPKGNNYGYYDDKNKIYYYMKIRPFLAF